MFVCVQNVDFVLLPTQRARSFSNYAPRVGVGKREHPPASETEVSGSWRAHLPSTDPLAKLEPLHIMMFPPPQSSHSFECALPPQPEGAGKKRFDGLARPEIDVRVGSTEMYCIVTYRRHRV